MWPPWGRSSPTVRGAGAVSSPRPTFRCSSFKDVHRIYNDDDPASPRKSDPQNHNPNPNRQSVPSRSRKKVFHRVRAVTSVLHNWPGRRDSHAPASRVPDPGSIRIAGAESRIVIYYTSIRAVRPTFDAYRAVKSILCGFRVKIDERDVALDKGFLDEVLRILGIGKEGLKLPAVFVGGKYLGGAEEVRHMDEVGELKKLVEGFPPAETRACRVCGGYRFVLCAECNGSRKVYGHKTGFRACTTCNENGLIKCHDCYPTALFPG